MSTVFFTGFPGFLGTALLPRVLHRNPDDEAVCVVQQRFLPQAQARVGDLTTADPSLAERIRLVVGDITVADLGLGEQRAELLDRTTQIHHLAAAYDLEVSREVGMRVNVEGTRHVLEFARACGDLQRFHYVSTCYVSGRYAGIFRESDLVKGQVFNNHYEETKYLAEVLVHEARDAGLPTTIYRPAVVGGDSATGATQKYDGPYVIIRWLLKQPRTAVLPVIGDPTGYRFNVVPRDWVIDAIEHLAARDDTVGGTYALADPEPHTVDEMIRRLGEATGRQIVRIPLPLKVAKGALRRVPGLQKLMEIPPAAANYFTQPTHYTTDATSPLLAEEGVALPDREAWLHAMVRFVEANPDVTSAAMV
jgi:thioester reductase-like protein